MSAHGPDVAWFEMLRRTDVPRVGAKIASLGKMIANLSTKGVAVPPGFASTAEAYWYFLEQNRLSERIGAVLADFQAGRITLAAFIEGKHAQAIASFGSERTDFAEIHQGLDAGRVPEEI